jgi:hypothetical protein
MSCLFLSDAGDVLPTGLGDEHLILVECQGQSLSEDRCYLDLSPDLSLHESIETKLLLISLDGKLVACQSSIIKVDPVASRFDTP